MKYNLLLKFLRGLVHIKRLFWWLGDKVLLVLANVFNKIGRFFYFVRYKTALFLKKLGVSSTKEWMFKRSFLQFLLLLLLVGVGTSQTKILPKRDLALASQKTAAYTLLGGDQVYGIEEVSLGDGSAKDIMPAWRIGVAETQVNGTGGETFLPFHGGDMAGITAGGTAFQKPILLSGVTGSRNKVIDYIIEPGDSLGGIAYQFGISVATLMWENNLTLRSIIRPGDSLRVPPTTGVVHKVKKGDTLKKIANTYTGKVEDIIRFNHLKEDGTDLVIGESIMVPNGIKQNVSVPRTSPAVTSLARQIAVPSASTGGVSASGFVWPSKSHIITQYFGLTHHAIDVGGPFQTPTYAARAGTVLISQCGWNSGYGCYIVIDHGDGVKTLYGHHSQLLVSPGDYVEAGQSIGLMGNTGKVRGVTGIHLHFEIQVKGARVNPLKYVR